MKRVVSIALMLVILLVPACGKAFARLIHEGDGFYVPYYDLGRYRPLSAEYTTDIIILCIVEDPLVETYLVAARIDALDPYNYMPLFVKTSDMYALFDEYVYLDSFDTLDELVTAYGTLSQGSRGTAVADLQYALIALGYLSGAADGVYGAKTKAAVQAFQRDCLTTADGVADAYTQILLYGLRANWTTSNTVIVPAAVATPAPAAMRFPIAASLGFDLSQFEGNSYFELLSDPENGLERVGHIGDLYDLYAAPSTGDSELVELNADIMLTDFLGSFVCLRVLVWYPSEVEGNLDFSKDYLDLTPYVYVSLPERGISYRSEPVSAFVQSYSADGLVLAAVSVPIGASLEQLFSMADNEPIAFSFSVGDDPVVFDMTEQQMLFLADLYGMYIDAGGYTGDALRTLDETYFAEILEGDAPAPTPAPTARPGFQMLSAAKNP
jgi:peptidoglycan hydrolase-like protein with peptidoglycan-binding domain